MFAFVGSRTTRERNARGEGITVFHFDPSSGQLTHVQTVADLVNPSFLRLNRTGDVLYTVHGDQDDVSAFRVDSATGQLAFLNRQCCEGKNPVHLALDPAERHLLVSNHVTGTLVVLPVAANGALGPVVQRFALEGQPGPHRWEQPFAKPHCNSFDPTGRWVLVPDKGLDKIFTFRFQSGQLTPGPVPFVDTREGAGPRHLAFHPQYPWVYVVNELDSTVTAYHFDDVVGRLTPFQIVASVADTFTRNNRASEIEVDTAGRWLYVSNRGEDSIALFEIEPLTGRLRLCQTTPSGGKTPRFFAIDPTQRWLLMLNEDSDQILVCPRDISTGTVGNARQTLLCPSPVCVVFGESKERQSNTFLPCTLARRAPSR